MKAKLILLFTVLAFCVNGLNAQNRRPMNPEDMAKRQSETLTDRLKLTDEQKQKVYDVSLKYAKERSEKMNSADDRDKRRQIMQESQQKQDEEITNLLTEDQQKEFEKYRKERESQRGNRRR
ncbi:MAG TPA: hypothetical protein DIT04_06740 [Dysgonomonas sp.]|nr:hypothetical protein [Dysgonomonas sp.]